jgi:hypothetical protein
MRFLLYMFGYFIGSLITGVVCGLILHWIFIFCLYLAGVNY